MALPNYSPSGKILFGSVPWDNGYTNVRLYTSLDSQYSDIVSRMVLSSSDYSYIGRNRRLKVSIAADRLYHCNYCMYRNDSLTDGYIYCFITDVKYINDQTSEIELETDVFNTYLYGVDWQIPACFIERETVPSESTKYLFTNEPDFSLMYEIDSETHKWFQGVGYVIMTNGEPKQNSSIVESVLNPGGWYSEPAPITAFRSIPNGCNFYFCPIDQTSGGASLLESFLKGITFAGSVESVVAIFTVPDFAATQLSREFQRGSSSQDDPYSYTATFDTPKQGSTVDGYSPRNKKLLYYPYNFCRLTDYNGSVSDLRFELMGSNTIAIKYAVSPACQAVVVPQDYQGITNFDVGMVVACGAQGSWSNNTFTTWLAQNSGTIAVTAAGIALAGVSGGSSIGAASKILSDAAKAGKVASPGVGSLVGKSVENDAAAMASKSMKQLGIAGAGAAAGYGQLYSAAHQPTVSRGQTNYNVLFATGVQGIHAQKVAVKAELAQQIDQFFDRWGYAVERIESVNITSRPAWNYVKTGGSAPRSLNGAPGSSAPFSRGRGTPADALDAIRRAFDGGVTFWHTTSGFGDYSQSNGV